MSDLIQRAQKAKILAANPSVPKWQRLHQGLQAFSGLQLSELPEAVEEQLEADLARVNRVLAQYPIETEEDYEDISDADLQQMLDTVDMAASRGIAAELDRIVDELDAGEERLPVEAIAEVREHRDLMIPKLIEVLREAIAAARTEDAREGNAHFFAIFLLTEFQAEESFPFILDAFSLPGELPFDLFGDAVTSTLARILAQFAGDRPEVMDALIRDPKLNEYVRWEAAQCYVHLVRDKRLTQKEAVERLRQHLLWAVAEKDEAVIGGLICVLVSFAPEEALADIEEAFRLGLVDEDLVGLGTVESSIAEGEERVRKELEWCSETGIDDTIEELRHWAAFAEKRAPRPAPPPPTPRAHFAAPREPAEPVAAPVSSGVPRAGRNDPCPCGSGKKFKKCCRPRG
jgi:hypothetical protein